MFLVSFSSAYSVEFFHSDHLGSPSVVSSGSGSEVWSADYDVFGATLNEEGNNKINYNSKEKDATGLLYYGARYYNSETGRFITVDPMKGQVSNIRSQNRYVYTQNNPLKYTDPTGNQVHILTGYEWTEQSNDMQKVVDHYGEKVATVKDISVEFLPGLKEFLTTTDLSSNNDILIIFGHSDQYRLWSTSSSTSGVTTSNELKAIKQAIGTDYSLPNELPNIDKVETLILMTCKPAGDVNYVKDHNKYNLQNFDFDNIVTDFLDAGVQNVEGLEDKLWMYYNEADILVPSNLEEFKRYTRKGDKTIINNNAFIEDLYGGYIKSANSAPFDIPKTAGTE